jgi:DnaJ-class molecular chaperone
MTDPYETLGVARDASEDQIRAAYRRLAKLHHPDLNPGKRGAEDRFKQISGAYALLSDPEKRGRFDRGEIDASGAERAPPRGAGAGAGAGGRGFNAEDFEGLFARAFGNRRRRAAARTAGEDMRCEIFVPFLEAANGAVQRVTLPDGRVLDIRIPEGFEDGQILRLKGKGHPAEDPAAQAGDALVTVHVVPHRFFERQGNDIFLELPVTLQEAVLGARIEVQTIKGPVTLAIPPASGQGTKLRLKGRGIAGGDQYVELNVVLPERPEPELADFLKGWKPRHPFDPRRGGLGGA